MKPLVPIHPRRLAAHAINPNLLPIRESRAADPLNGRLQVIVEVAHNRPADVISQIPGPDEQDVDAGDLGDFVDLSTISKPS